jgi:hypothetical protein
MDDTASHPVPTRLHAALPPAAEAWHREPFETLAAAEERLDALEGTAAEMRLVVTRRGGFVVEWRG